MLNRKSIRLFVICLLVSSLSVMVCFAGGKPEVQAEDSAKSPYEGITLRIMGSTHSHTEALQKKMIELAENEFGMKLEIVTYGWGEAVRKLRLDYAAGATEWEIVYTDNRYLTMWKNMGLATPVQDYIDNPSIADPGIKKELEDTIGPFKDLAVRDGELYQFPQTLDTLIMAYRTDLFENASEKDAFKQKYGYELNVPTTYDEFYDVSEFFTRESGEELAGTVLREPFYGTSHSAKRGDYIQHDYLPYVVSFGGELYHDPQTMRPVWNDEAHKKAMRYMLSLKPFMPPNAGVMTSGESTALFAQGRVAMIIEWIDRTIKACTDPESSKVLDKWEYTITPSVPGTGVNAAAFKNIISYLIYSKSENQEAAYKLLERLYQRDVQLELIQDEGLIPPRPSILNDPKVTSLSWAKNLAKVLSPDRTYFWHPPIEINMQIIDFTGESLGIVWTEKNVDQEFDRTQAELVKLYKEAGYLK